MCICRICGNGKKNEIYHVKERMINKGDTFNYFLCSNCGTLQLEDFNIGNMGRWYQDNYYSFKNETSLSDSFLGKRILYRLLFSLMTSIPMTDNFQQKCWESFAPYMYLAGLSVCTKSKILDVGCGTGRWLDFLSAIGFKNLYGIDRYCDDHLPGFTFQKTDLLNYDHKDFDVITFHHSFEHMDNPYEILECIKRLLKKNGVCIIRVPVCGGKVWREYKTDWFQIDAPRHYFLYSEDGMKEICKRMGFRIKRIIYDSFPNQFIISEYYKNTTLSLSEISVMISKKDNERYRRIVRKLNRNHEGDMASFYLEKT